MFDALYISATGMQAQQLSVNTIANNLANVNTNGFKKSRVDFTDLMNAESARADMVSRMHGVDATQNVGPLSHLPQTGNGIGVSSVSVMFDAGTISQTGSMWDLAIQGDGFLQVVMPDGSAAYSRGGTLKVGTDGQLTTLGGQPLKGNISIPANATSMTIAADGTVTATVPNQTNPVSVGQLQMARFANPSSLIAQSGGLFVAGDSTGEPVTGYAGQDGIGTLQQGYLEGSNVNMVSEMVNLMVAQRGYEASLKVAQTADDLLGLVNNLRR